MQVYAGDAMFPIIDLRSNNTQNTIRDIWTNEFKVESSPAQDLFLKKTMLPNRPVIYKVQGQMI